MSLHHRSPYFHALLREICREEYEKGHQQLCALVVLKATGRPGAGYFTHLASHTGSDQGLEDKWQADVDRVHSYWQQRPNPYADEDSSAT